VVDQEKGFAFAHSNYEKEFQKLMDEQKITPGKKSTTSF
jgi:hypothetical protein